MKMKFRKPNPLVSAGILFLLISVIVASKLYASGHTYHIYAAILELCLDGLIFGCIVVFLQERQKAKQVKESKDTLRNSLTVFVSDFVWWLSVGAVQDMDKLTIKFNDSQRMVSLEEQAAQALKALKAGKLIPEGMIDPVKRYGSKESIMLKCLLPVAAQLGGDHLKTWFNIIRSLDAIVEDKDGKNVHSTVQYFLERIIEFTRLK